MNTQFSPTNQTGFWSRADLLTLRNAFCNAGIVEEIIERSMTHLAHSTQLNEQHPTALPKLRALYPPPKTSSSCRFQEHITTLTYLLQNITDNPMNFCDAQQINEMLRSTQYANIYSPQDLLDLRHFLLLLKSFFSKTDSSLESEEVSEKLWEDFNKPGNPSEWVQQLINKIDKEMLERNGNTLKKLQAVLGSIEYATLKMTELNATKEELAEIDQAREWKAAYLSAESDSDRYKIASTIIAFKDRVGRHALPPTQTLDAYCFLAEKDNSNHLKALALQYARLIPQEAPISSLRSLQGTPFECSIQ